VADHFNRGDNSPLETSVDGTQFDATQRVYHKASLDSAFRKLSPAPIE